MVDWAVKSPLGCFCEATLRVTMVQNAQRLGKRLCGRLQNCKLLVSAVFFCEAVLRATVVRKDHTHQAVNAVCNRVVEGTV